jgi:AcrR family transcriptional regulator
MPRQKMRTAALEQQLLRSALEIVEAGDRTLTARTVALAAGTSTGALYELFGDKAGLIKAIFHDGFRQWADLLDQVPTTSNARQDMITMLQTTRTFSKTNPMLFEIMFARPFAEFQPTPDDYGVAKGIYAGVTGRVDRLLAETGSTGDRIDIARILISVNRGLIAAEIGGILGSSQRSIDRRWHLAINTLLDGLATGPSPITKAKRATRTA